MSKRILEVCVLLLEEKCVGKMGDTTFVTGRRLIDNFPNSEDSKAILIKLGYREVIALGSNRFCSNALSGVLIVVSCYY